MTTTPVTAHSDFNKPFILYTDILGGGIRVVLHQKGDDEKEKLIAYASRAFNEHEKKYPITEQKCLAVVWRVEKFKQYLEVKPFTIITDHIALETVKTANLPTERRVRWLCKL